MTNIKELLSKRLLSIKEEPVKAFALLYPYILVIGIGFGFLYLNDLNLITRQNIPTVLPDTTKVVDLKIVSAKSIPPVDIFTLSQPTEQLINKGKTLYTTNCVSCHGEEGKGNGTATAALNPPPRNFTSKDGWKNGSKLSQMYQTLQEGIAGGGMVAFDFILPEDRIAIINYIRSAFVVDSPKDTKDELASLDQMYNLSKGLQISPQIPISAAIELISSESNQRYQTIVSVLKNINSDKSATEAEIFNNITYDKMRALTTLNSSSQWHQNQKKFVDIVYGGIKYGGFSNKVSRLSKEEWNALFNYLSKQI